eukprot:TCONS_00003516-protein
MFISSTLHNKINNNRSVAASYNMVQGLRKSKYIIEKHSEQVIELLAKHLLPTYMKRLGITREQQKKDLIEVEAILDPGHLKREIFEKASYVALDKSDKVVACSLNYFISKEEWLKYFVEPNKSITQNTNYSKHIRKYCQQQYDLYHDVIDLTYDKYNLQTILYLEDGVTLPEYRGLRIAQWLQRTVLGDFGEQYGILGEGMVPMDRINAGKVNPAFNAWRENGFLTVKEIVTHDKVMVPVWFRPPKVN